MSITFPIHGSHCCQSNFQQKISSLMKNHTRSQKLGLLLGTEEIGETQKQAEKARAGLERMEGKFKSLSLVGVGALFGSGSTFFILKLLHKQV
uniref:Uncharacterized protein n=1 Tax=Cucumis sativus TaxID=3659 RepID=A0A0A0KIV3_CUCSA